METRLLGDICDVLDSKRKPITKRDRVPGPYPYYGATGIVDYVGNYIFDEKLVLIGEDGAKWAAGEKTAFSVSGKTWVNNHAHVIRPHRDKVCDEWIVYYLTGNDLSEYVTGLTVPKLNQAQLRSIPIPIPPLPVQKAIVAKLDAAFASIEQAIGAAEQNAENAKQLFQSYLSDVFERGGEGWKSATIGQLCNELFAGGDVPKERMQKYKSSEFQIPIYTNGEKDKGLYGYTDKARVVKPSITISARGTIGYSEVRLKPFYPAIRLIVATPNSHLISLQYFQYAIKSLKFVHSGSSIPQLTVPMIREYQIKLPIALDSQDDLAQKIEHLLSKTDEFIAVKSQVKLKLNELKQSLLQQAFNGQLVDA